MKLLQKVLVVFALVRRALRRAWLKVENARKKRLYLQLIERLGGECAICKSKDRLQVDHCSLEGRVWKSDSLAFRDRVSRYLREEARGIPLRVLCIHHNSADGSRRRWEKYRRAA